MWQQLKIQLKSDDALELEQTLIESGALSISYLDAEDQPIFQKEPDSTPLWDNIFLLCLFDGNVELDSLLADLQRNTQVLNRENINNSNICLSTFLHHYATMLVSSLLKLNIRFFKFLVY